MARGVESMWPFWSFWALTLNRVFTLVGTGLPSEAKEAQLGTRWVVSTLLYVGWVFISALVPFPALGIDPSMLPANPRVGGLWVEQPQRVLAAGAGYFFCQAYLDLKPPRWLTHPTFRRRSRYG